MKYHFELVNLTEANAFSLPGGHIYISRKIIALAESDDELAGILAHELGHEVTHQGAAYISRWMQSMGIPGVTDEQDIRRRFNQLLDTQAKSKVRAPDAEDDQLAADAVAVEAMARAGYNPQAFATASPSFVRISPIHNYAVGLLDIEQNKMVFGWKSAALDAWGTELACELIDGQLAAAPVADRTSAVTLKLSDGSLVGVYSAAISSDLSWLALSERSRGALWSLKEGKREYYLHGCSGAFFDDKEFHGEVFDASKEKRSIVHLDTTHPDPRSATATDLKTDDREVPSQVGAFLLTKKRLPKDGRDSATCQTGWFTTHWETQMMSELDVQDVVTQKVLWTRSFPKRIDSFHTHPYADSVAFIQCNKDIMQIEFDQLSTGRQLASLLLDTNKHSFHATDAIAAGEYLVVADNERRIGIYGKDGHNIARVFGERGVAAPSSGLLAVHSERKEMTVYELASGQKRGAIAFPAAVLFHRFDATGKTLLVITSDQTAYAFDMEKLKTVRTAKAN